MYVALLGNGSPAIPNVLPKRSCQLCNNEHSREPRGSIGQLTVDKYPTTSGNVLFPLNMNVLPSMPSYPVDEQGNATVDVVVHF